MLLANISEPADADDRGCLRPLLVLVVFPDILKSLPLVQGERNFILDPDDMTGIQRLHIHAKGKTRIIRINGHADLVGVADLAEFIMFFTLDHQLGIIVEVVGIMIELIGVTEKLLRDFVGARSPQRIPDFQGRAIIFKTSCAAGGPENIHGNQLDFRQHAAGLQGIDQRLAGLRPPITWVIVSFYNDFKFFTANCRGER